MAIFWSLRVSGTLGWGPQVMEAEEARFSEPLNMTVGLSGNMSIRPSCFPLNYLYLLEFRLI